MRLHFIFHCYMFKTVPVPTVKNKFFPVKMVDLVTYIFIL